MVALVLAGCGGGDVIIECNPACPAGTRCTESGGVIPESVLWALSAGRAMAASDLPVVRTYAGGAARYFPPGDAGTLATHLEALLASPEARDTLVAQGRRTAAALDWAETERTVAALWAGLPGD